MMLAIACALLLSTSSVMGFSMGTARGRSISMMAEKSKALPFLSRPAKLDGTLVGDFGFDPLGLTNTLPSLNYVVASELKHGRVAMLAVVGFIVQQYIQIVTPEANPLKAISALGYGPNLQILSFIGVIELATWKQTYSGENPGALFCFNGKLDEVIRNELKIFQATWVLILLALLRANHLLNTRTFSSRRSRMAVSL
jgi:hypothetical protein